MSADRSNYTTGRGRAGSCSHPPKEEEEEEDQILDIGFSSNLMHSTYFPGDNLASSSGTNLRSSFLSMGFLPSLVDKVIIENGEDNPDLLLETLFTYSALHDSKSESCDDTVFRCGGDGASPSGVAAYTHSKALHRSNSKSSDSLDSLFDDKDDTSAPQYPAHVHPKDEPDIDDGDNEEKRVSLLSMNFSIKEVDFAMEKLGKETAVPDLVDFIIAAQMEENSENLQITAQNEESNTEKLYGTMDKTLRLLEMGFTESQISLAIDKFGSEVPISELADFIFATQVADTFGRNGKYSSASSDGNGKYTGNVYRSGHKRCTSDTFTVKEEDDYDLNEFGVEDDRKGKKPKDEYFDESSSCAGPIWMESREGGPKIKSRQIPFHQVTEGYNKFSMSKPLKLISSKSVDKAVAKPPYFLYGNVVNLSQNSWEKISQFLYALEPEFISAEFFSALSRREGYLHNLPMENRCHVNPKSPMTIEDAMPHTKKWWPSWDTRKHISCICTETSGISELCERLGKILIGSHGLLSVEQQKDLIHQCKTLNLMWVGLYKLAPIEPEHLERILGYPIHHTKTPELSLIERLHCLKICFQTDALGYHLSVLKSRFPEGLTVLSIFSGIGGAEITLHRLGIRLKGVVSVENSETMRKILRRWWTNTEQTGELVQIEDIQKLTTNKLENMINKFGGFDLIISQNPCTFSSKSCRIAADGDSLAGFDFSLFYEFVRVLQRVRGMERKW